MVERGWVMWFMGTPSRELELNAEEEEPRINANFRGLMRGF